MDDVFDWLPAFVALTNAEGPCRQRGPYVSIFQSKLIAFEHFIDMLGMHHFSVFFCCCVLRIYLLVGCLFLRCVFELLESQSSSIWSMCIGFSHVSLVTHVLSQSLSLSFCMPVCVCVCFVIRRPFLKRNNNKSRINSGSITSERADTLRNKYILLLKRMYY